MSNKTIAIGAFKVPPSPQTMWKPNTPIHNDFQIQINIARGGGGGAEMYMVLKRCDLRYFLLKCPKTFGQDFRFIYDTRSFCILLGSSMSNTSCMPWRK